MAKRIRCPNCGYEGPAQSLVKGSVIVEIALWLMLIVPGIIYTLWRATSRYDACAACGWAHVVQISESGRIAPKEPPSDIGGLVFILIFFGLALGFLAVYGN